MTFIDNGLQHFFSLKHYKYWIDKYSICLFEKLSFNEVSQMKASIP